MMAKNFTTPAEKNQGDSQSFHNYFFILKLPLTEKFDLLKNQVLTWFIYTIYTINQDYLHILICD